MDADATRHVCAARMDDADAVMPMSSHVIYVAKQERSATRSNCDMAPTALTLERSDVTSSARAEMSVHLVRVSNVVR